MLTHKRLATKRWKKELKRRALRAMKRRLQGTYGPSLGEHFYRLARASSGRQQLVRQFMKRGASRPPLPRMVPMDTPHHAKKSLFARIFRRH